VNCEGGNIQIVNAPRLLQAFLQLLFTTLKIVLNVNVDAVGLIIKSVRSGKVGKVWEWGAKVNK